MLITINPQDARPIYQQVVDSIKALIARGELTEGVSLPPVRQVAADLGVNLNTIAAAYRELQSEGLVTIRHGSGAVVASRTIAGKNDDVLRTPLHRIDATHPCRSAQGNDHEHGERRAAEPCAGRIAMSEWILIGSIALFLGIRAASFIRFWRTPFYFGADKFFGLPVAPDVSMPLLRRYRSRLMLVYLPDALCALGSVPLGRSDRPCPRADFRSDRDEALSNPRGDSHDSPDEVACSRRVMEAGRIGCSVAQNSALTRLSRSALRARPASAYRCIAGNRGFLLPARIG